MGIRIHKKLGYGLTDVEVEGGELKDSRFNPNGYLSLDYEDAEEKFTFEGLKQYLQIEYQKEKNSKGFSMICHEIGNIIEKKVADLYDMVCWEEEFGLPNVVLFQPPHKDWTRFDDIIDYVEDDPQENSVKELKRSIYPYESWMNSDTGETTFEVDGTKYHYLHIRQVINFSFNYNEKLFPEAGFNSMEEADKKVVPFVPEIIRHLCKYLEVFKDEKTIYQLKPLIYTYWG